MSLNCDKCSGNAEPTEEGFKCTNCGLPIGEDLDIPEEMF